MCIRDRRAWVSDPGGLGFGDCEGLAQYCVRRLQTVGAEDAGDPRGLGRAPRGSWSLEALRQLLDRLGSESNPLG
eukprot:8426923-Alexandrium_andersonii.AAC.1